ncbi:MAG TPA: sugar nucleotide-binding protein [Bryobacteraceae bacterium]|nr:sugar nucleotide-binding protein [Bryobacteraceae bacterium]
MTKPRLLLIGANGFLGQHLSKAGGCFDVFEADLAASRGERGLAMDVTSPASVDAAFRHARPNVAVLLAAVSDIDQCEQHPQIAEAVNVCGAVHVAEACARTGARLVFTSSAAVFDGTRHGYTESDAPTPLSVYGRTKARAEELILAKLPDALILRLALAIGFAEGSGTNAMLNRFAAKLGAGECVWLPDFEYRNPIDAVTLSTLLLELLGAAGAAGIFHVGAREAISRFELGAKLAQRMGFSPQLVQTQTEPLPGRAPRGLHHYLLAGKLREVCRTPIPSCDDVIERALHATS